MYDQHTMGQWKIMDFKMVQKSNSMNVKNDHNIATMKTIEDKENYRVDSFLNTISNAIIQKVYCDNLRRLGDQQQRYTLNF